MAFESSELICHLIDSIVDDEAFAVLPEQIAKFANTAGVLINTHSDRLVRVDGTYGLSPELLSQYQAYFWQRDVWQRIYEGENVNFAVPSDNFIATSDFKETEIYRDLLRHEGRLTRCAGFISDLGEGERLVFGTQRTESMGEFEPEMLHGLNLLADPLTRMFQARRRLATQRRNVAQIVLDDQIDAVLVVDPQGAPQYANASALRMIATANLLVLRAGRMSSPDPLIASSLRKLITSACKGRGGGDVTFPPHLPGYRGSVEPLPGANTPLACIRLRDEKLWAGARADQARVLHGLTAAETQLAEALLLGLTPTDIAEQRNVSMPTVRTQLRSLFAKAGVTGQAELVKLLGRL
jgi:DNA-binding CsgD family transcriptional regulator/PAS domain-containing protein